MLFVIRCFYEERQSTFSWSEAELRCQASGSHLVTINSEEQLQEVKDALGGVIAESYWIGLNDQDTEGTYVWSDGTQLGDWSNWEAEEPDAGIEKNCVAMFTSGFAWKTSNCTKERYHICSKPKGSSQLNRWIGK